MSRHISILLNPITDALTSSIEAGAKFHEKEPLIWIDCTFGGGGHTAALLQRLQQWGPTRNWKVIGLDQDPEVHTHARQKFEKELIQGKLELVQSDFASALPRFENQPVVGILADLGFSSDQVDDPQRGLSFLREGPFDMRMNPTAGETAWDLIHRLDERELADLIFQWGEDRNSRKIARLLMIMRDGGELKNSTTFIAEAIRRAYPPRERFSGKIHPATRTFQALRIAVNQELDQLDQLLTVAPGLLIPGGRLAVISFHSLEDRKVKVRFKNDDHFQSLWKKPLEADETEILENPRSRSAKLRVIEKNIPDEPPGPCYPFFKGTLHEAILSAVGTSIVFGFHRGNGVAQTFGSQSKLFAE